MSKDGRKKTQELLVDLRNGSSPERLKAAELLGEVGGVEVIPALRRALKRLKAPVPYSQEPAAEPTDNSHWVYDPDAVLRLAILDAITRLLLHKENEISKPALKQVISQLFDLPDGSQLRIMVNAPAAVEGSLAASFFEEHLVPALKQIETMR